MRRLHLPRWATALSLLLLYLLPLAIHAIDSAADPHTPTTHPIPLILSDPTSSLPPTSTTPSPPPTRHTRGATLAYLTPWHRSGFSLALSHPHLFTLLAPVWFQVKLQPTPSAKHAGRTSLSPVITGSHDLDSVWLASVLSLPSPHRPLITPRYILELSPHHLTRLAREPKLQRAITRTLLSHLTQHQLHGLTLEATDLHAVVARDAPEARGGANDFIRMLAAACHAASPPLTFTLVVRPWFPRSPYFAHADWVEVERGEGEGGEGEGGEGEGGEGGVVDYLSLMTYDYSSGSVKPGPNAPLGWVKAAVDALLKGEDGRGVERAGWRERVLVGVNFYGMHWKGGQGGERGEPVVGGQYEELARGGKRVWEDASGEERMEVKGGGVVYYPTPRSLRARVDLVNAEGCGLSIWELGQGLPPLLDEL